MASPLGPAQHLVLLALDVVLPGGSPLTPREIADIIAGRLRLQARRPTAEAEAANAALRRLERHGLVERLGTAASGARCWAITTAGRDALNREDDRG